MRRSTAIIVALTVIVCATPVLIFLSLPSTPRQLPRPQAFSKIEEGMTQAEVEALVGCPPGYYGRYELGLSKMSCVFHVAPPGSVQKNWDDDAHLFMIWFDQDNRVVRIVEERGYERMPPQNLSEWLFCIRQRYGL